MTERKTRITTKCGHEFPLYRMLWCKIRYFQQLYQIGDEELANELGVHKRTLRDYDKTAENVTFGKLDRFLRANGLSLNELLDL